MRHHPFFRFAVRCLFGIAIMAVSVVARAESTPDATIDQLKKLTLEDLVNVEVTSVSRAPEKLSDTASAIQVITHDEIVRSGALTLPEALSLAGNLNVARKNAHDWGISARGFNTDLANKLLVMIDGRTVYTPLFSGVRWDAQDYLLEDIDRIEVVSGPGGSVWGANAVNGVINIVSKSSRDTQGGYAEAIGGTVGQGYNVRYGGTATPQTTYRVYAKYMDEAAEKLPSGASADDDWLHKQVGFRIDSGTADEPTLTLQGDAYKGTEGFVGGGTSMIGGGNVLGRISREFGDGSEFQLQAFFDRGYLWQPTLQSALAAAGMFGDGLDTYDIDFQERLQFTRQRFVWGLGYRDTEDRSQASPGLAFAPPASRQELFSGFAQDEVSVTDAVTGTIGTKIEHTTYTGFELEPTARLRWKLASDDLVWIAVSRAVRTPSRVDRDIREPSRAPIILAGGSDFRSERLIAYELGYRAQFSPQVVGSIAAFYNRYDRIRSLRTTPVTTFPFFFANDLEGHTYGVELSTTYQPLPWWRLSVAYDLLRENIHVAPGATDLNRALNETADPEHQAALRSSIDLPHGFEIDGNLRWTDALTVNNNGRPATVPAYAELDLHLGWQVSHNVECALVGRNLLDRQHPEFGAPSPLRVELRRNVYATATWRF